MKDRNCLNLIISKRRAQNVQHVDLVWVKVCLFWREIICNARQWPEPFANTNCWLKAEWEIVKIFPGRNLICGNVLHRNCDEVCSWQESVTVRPHASPASLGNRMETCMKQLWGLADDSRGRFGILFLPSPLSPWFDNKNWSGYRYNF